MKIRAKAICWLVSALVATWAHGADRYVWTNGLHQGGFTTWTDAATNIQDAITAAQPGETVWVTNGTYVCNRDELAISDGKTSLAMVVIGKSIRLRSVNGPAVTTLDGAGSAGAQRHVVFINTHPATGAVVDGFTIKGGYVTSAQYPSWPHYHGGGILMRSTAAVVTNCVITGNYGLNGSGLGAMFGGTYVDCVISNNTGSVGVYIRDGGVIRRCRVVNNPSGGIRCENPGPVVENCEMIQNGTYASSDGGGVYLSNGGTLRNSLLTGNSGRYGGGVNMYMAGANTPSLQNCTIAGNTGTVGGGYYTVGGGTAGSVQNTIIYGNTFGSGGYSPETSIAVGTTPKISFSCSPTDLSAFGASNITSHPLYANAAAGNYRLKGASPCIDRGTNASWITSQTLDLDRNRRRHGVNVDIGAYEFIPQATVVQVQ